MIWWWKYAGCSILSGKDNGGTVRYPDRDIQDKEHSSMAKAKKAARVRVAARARAERGSARKAAVKSTAPKRPAAARTSKTKRQPEGGPPASRMLTRVTHETEVRGSETRIERVVERTPKTSPPDADRANAARGRYVYCIIRASAALRFGTIGMDEQWADVYTINYKDMAAVVSDVM